LTVTDCYHPPPTLEKRRPAASFEKVDKMGKKSRQKRDRASVTPRQQFQFAMIGETMEEIRDHGKPCILCGEETRNAGCWFPDSRLASYLGAPPGKDRVFVYSLCDGCHATDVEERFLAERRTRLAAADARLEVSDGVVIFSGPEDLERFSTAWDRHEPPAWKSP
jgi:hypothetical protein